MFKCGKYPFYECSSRGDKRFSAFFAFVKKYGNTIENLYQAAKVFDDGSSGLSWKQAKGRAPINYKECKEFYSHLWDTYIKENPHLLPVLVEQSGLSDMFGKPGSVCQAGELWRIRCAFIKGDFHV